MTTIFHDVHRWQICAKDVTWRRMQRKLQCSFCGDVPISPTTQPQQSMRAHNIRPTTKYDNLAARAAKRSKSRQHDPADKRLQDSRNPKAEQVERQPLGLCHDSCFLENTARGIVDIDRGTRLGSEVRAQHAMEHQFHPQEMKQTQQRCAILRTANHLSYHRERVQITNHFSFPFLPPLSPLPHPTPNHSTHGICARTRATSSLWVPTTHRPIQKDTVLLIGRDVHAQVGLNEEQDAKQHIRCQWLWHWEVQHHVLKANTFHKKQDCIEATYHSTRQCKQLDYVFMTRTLFKYCKDSETIGFIDMTSEHTALTIMIERPHRAQQSTKKTESGTEIEEAPRKRHHHHFERTHDRLPNTPGTRSKHEVPWPSMHQPHRTSSIQANTTATTPNLHDNTYRDASRYQTTTNQTFAPARRSRKRFSRSKTMEEDNHNHRQQDPLSTPDARKPHNTIAGTRWQQQVGQT